MLVMLVFWMHTIKKNIGALTVASKVTGLEENTKKCKYVVLF
jgi:hypothetical protein